MFGLTNHKVPLSTVLPTTVSDFTYNYFEFVLTQTKVSDFQTERSSSVSGSCNGIQNLFYSFLIVLRYIFLLQIDIISLILSYILCVVKEHVNYLHCDEHERWLYFPHP